MRIEYKLKTDPEEVKKGAEEHEKLVVVEDGVTTEYWLCHMGHQFDV